MAGISAISLGAYINNLSFAMGGQPLTPATKAKLEALGIDTTNIKTEAEGKAMLIAAQAERSNSAQKSKQPKGNQNDEVMEKVKQLADDLNVTYSDSDTVDDIVDRISSKVEKLIAMGAVIGFQCDSLLAKIVTICPIVIMHNKKTNRYNLLGR